MNEESPKEGTALTPLEELYAEVRQIRETNFPQDVLLHSVIGKILDEFPEEWLLQLEVLELLEKHDKESPLKKLLLDQLEMLSQEERYVRLIQNGLDVIFDRRHVTV